MPRLAKRLILAIALGVLLNIALAVVPSLVFIVEEGPITRIPPSPVPEGPSLDEIVAWKRLQVGRPIGEAGCALSDVSYRRPKRGSADLREGTRHLGIPWRSMSYDCTVSFTGATTITQGHVVSQYAPGKPRVIPLTILWPGFLLNTLFFTIAAFAALSLGRTLISAHRRRRARCTNCGYSLTGLTTAVCPECAAAAPTPSS